MFISDHLDFLLFIRYYVLKTNNFFFKYACNRTVDIILNNLYLILQIVQAKLNMSNLRFDY